METQRYSFKITFTTPVLGTQPDKNVATKYLMTQIIDRSGNGEPPADEIETLSDKLDKGTTIFNMLRGNPVYLNYHVKGFLKEAGGAFNGLEGVRNLKSKIENYVFVEPRIMELRLPDYMWIPHELITQDPNTFDLKVSGVTIIPGSYTYLAGTHDNWPDGGQPGYVYAPARMVYLERTLRAMTAQGPRTTLARSAMLPIGTWFEGKLEVFKKEITEDMLRQIFGYGKFKGLGQWRNSSSYGTFEYILTLIE